jgi:iron-sulfur cluster repair protein YtfE (RIC family)
MKRDPALTLLSHEHHQALHQALRMKRASEADCAEVSTGVLAFWDEEGAEHFRIEEELLLPALARYLAPEDERVVRVLVDHVWIRERMERMRGGVEAEELQELGARLDDHVRHEERIVFPLIEETLGAEELKELGQRLEAAEAG